MSRLFGILFAFNFSPELKEQDFKILKTQIAATITSYENPALGGYA